MKGKIRANWIQWSDVKRITEIEIGQGEIEELSCSTFYSPIKDGILNFLSVPLNQLGVVWLARKTSKTTVYFHYIKKNFKPPHEHFVNLICHRKAYTGSWLAMPNLQRYSSFIFLVCFFVENAVVLGFGLILQGKLFSSYYFLNGEKNKLTT